MSDIEAVFQLYLMLVGLVGFFVLGWGVATAFYCLRALHNVEPVRPVLKIMMEEW
jgi:hypothetical protein